MKSDLPDDRELSTWAEDFREPRASPSVLASSEIVAQAARDARRERTEWLTQIAATLFAVLVFLGLVAWKRTAIITALAAVVLPTLCVSFGLFAHLRGVASTAGSGGGASVRSHVALAVRRRRASHDIARMSRAVLAFLAVVFWIWLPLFVHTNAAKFGAEPWRILIGATVALAVFALGWRISVRALRKARDDLARWEDAERSLTDDP